MQSKLPENLKSLRKSKGWTQQALADRLGLTRPTLGAYEEGRSEPKLSVLIDMAACFGTTVDTLVRGEKDAESAERAKGDRMRVLTVSVDSASDRERVVVVPVKAAAGYAHGYGDPEWVSRLPTFGLPLKELAPDSTYRMFQIEGDSMLPIPSGSYILCQYVDDWMSVGGLRPHIVVTRNDGVVFKRIENDLPGGGRLVLHSDNPAFAPYAVAGDDVVEVWRAAAYLSFELPSALDGQPASAASLRSALDTLRGEIDALKRSESAS
jgi:transcriptional regulator with XRE-family HTH domain|tara:strand:- start:2463 stop:3260 length:798 start_codon:yes stop_codon:yes gene_type:complete